MMYTRQIEPQAREALKKYRALCLIGPRQSGKTTLARQRLCPDFAYYSLESPDTRRRVESDPRGFLASLKDGTILDEIQKLPDLLSYLQQVLDEPGDTRQFILSGSNSLLLSSKISQSLAGRSRILRVLPLSFQEIRDAGFELSVDEIMIRGSYPRIYYESLEPADWYGAYDQTYVEKDVRDLLSIENLTLFDRFVRVTASRIGQLTNFDSLATEVGLSQPTMKRWMSVLEASFVIFTLVPHFKNFSKRLIKSPKLYFHDTGLLCWILGIRTAEQLANHPLRGYIFENMMIMDAVKRYYQIGNHVPLYFWRDQHGHEVDLVIDRSTHLDCIEIKSSSTFNPDFVKQILWLNQLQNTEGGTVLYTGNEAFPYKNIEVRPWNQWELVL